MVYVSLLTSILLATAALARPSSGLQPSPAGAAWENYPAVRVFVKHHVAGLTFVSQGSFTAVTGTFVVPSFNSTGSVSIWVGIDGITCATAILQTGIDITNEDGDISYDGELILFNPVKILINVSDN